MEQGERKSYETYGHDEIVLHYPPLCINGLSSRDIGKWASRRVGPAASRVRDELVCFAFFPFKDKKMMTIYFENEEVTTSILTSSFVFSA